MGVRNIARTDCLALLRDFVLCRFEWIRKDLSSAQGSHLYRFRDASCSARPTAASSRPLRCSCAGPIVSASVRFCPSLFREAYNSPLPSASLHQSVRFYMFPYSDAHHSQPSSASLHPYVRFSLFPCSEAYPSAFSSASSRPCSAKPTTALSHPLRCINLSVSTCSYAATPTIAVLRPLRCICRSVSACFHAARRIPASFCPLRRPRASSALFSLVRSDCWAEAQSPFSIAKPLQGFPERLRY